MKMLAAAAMVIGLMAIPATAQHPGARSGGGHPASGFSAHAGGFAGHAGFAAGAPTQRFGGFAQRGPAYSNRYGSFAPHYGGFAAPYRGIRPTGIPPRTGPTGNRVPYRPNYYGRGGSNPNGDHRGGDRDHHHRRPDYDRFNGINYGYVYPAPWYGFEIDPGSLGPDWLNYDDDSTASAQGYYGGNASGPYQDYGAPGPAYGDAGPQQFPAPQQYAPPQQNPVQRPGGL